MAKADRTVFFSPVSKMKMTHNLRTASSHNTYRSIVGTSSSLVYKGHPAALQILRCMFGHVDKKNAAFRVKRFPTIVFTKDIVWEGLRTAENKRRSHPLALRIHCTSAANLAR